MGVIYRPLIWSPGPSSHWRSSKRLHTQGSALPQLMSISLWSQFPHGQYHRPKSFPLSLPMTFTSIILPTHFFLSPSLVSNLLELFHLGNLKTEVTYSPISISICLLSLPGCLLCDLAELSNPESRHWASTFNFSYPAKHTLKTNPESIQPLLLHAAKNSWKNAIITFAGANSSKISQITWLLNLLSNPLGGGSLLHFPHKFINDLHSPP